MTVGRISQYGRPSHRRFRRGSAVSWATVVMRSLPKPSIHHVDGGRHLSHAAGVLSARGIGRPTGRARLGEDLLQNGGLLVQDGLDVLAVPDDLGERVAVDLVEVSALGTDPDGEQGLDGVLCLLLLAHGV